MAMKSQISKLILFCCIFGASKSALAEDCANRPNEQALRECLSLEYERTDSDMSLLYKRVLSELPSDRKSGLVQSQRAWIKFRDAACGFIGDERKGGSSQGWVIAICKTQITEERSLHLKKQIACRRDCQDCSTY